MTTTDPTAHTSAVADHAPENEPSRRRGHIGLIVIGSVAAGLIAALLLSLAVFAGAREHVITGALLLGFALGWAMLAVLSARWTDQPQRWALVPAAAMGAVGAAVLLLPLNNTAMRSAGWIWPPLLAALAVWIVIQARAHLHNAARPLVVYPLCAVLALSAVGGITETVWEAASHNPHPAAGATFDVGGHRLYLECSGTGSPTVLLANGAGEHTPSWAWITPAVARDTRVCAYDRAGLGWSSAAAGPQDGVQLATDLHALLKAAHVPGPYVLAGHSVGGAYNMVFAARYPNEVAGMVLLDSSSPEQFTLPTYPSFYSGYRRVSALFPTLARLGLARVTFGTGFAGLPAAARGQEQALVSTTTEQNGQRDEWSMLPTAFNQAKALRDFGAKPLVVITAGRGQLTGWPAVQDKLAKLSSNSAHRTIAGAEHAALLDDHRFAADSSQAIHDVLTSVRTGAPVTP
jgi:pimeloyl-ACP methyl ester carboxylesterase